MIFWEQIDYYDEIYILKEADCVYEGLILYYIKIANTFLNIFPDFCFILFPCFIVLYSYRLFGFIVFMPDKEVGHTSSRFSHNVSGYTTFRRRRNVALARAPHGAQRVAAVSCSAIIPFQILH